MVHTKDMENNDTAPAAGTTITIDRGFEKLQFILDSDATIKDGYLNFTGSRVTKTGRVMKRQNVIHTYKLAKVTF